MRTAIVKVWCATQFTVEIHETEPGISNIPVVCYRFVAQGNELKCIPAMLRELGVEAVDVHQVRASYHVAAYLFARAVFSPVPQEVAMVQQKFC